jgi:LCP family protein required for cell wall assembly
LIGNLRFVPVDDYPPRQPTGPPAHGYPSTPPPPELDPRGAWAARAGARQAEPNGGGRRRGDVTTGVLLGVRIVAAALSLAILIGAGYAWANYRQLDTKVRRVMAIDKKDAPAKDIDGKAQNILIVGIDDRETATNKELKEIGVPRDGGSLNTDTMMILHVPADGKRARVISFPRDLWVNIPGVGPQRLNSAYAYGVQKMGKSRGWQVLVHTMENLTGLTIDHFAAVDLIGFYRISNAIGGVWVCLNRSYSKATDYVAYNLPKGRWKAQGRSALAFVRQRHDLPRGDLDRIVRQQYFLSAVFREVATAGVLLNPLKLNHLVNAVAASLQVDKTMKMANLAQQMSGLTAGNLRFTQIPTTGANVGGADVQIATTSIPAFVKKFIGVDLDQTLANAKTMDPTAVTVDVRNGSGRSGWADANAAILKRVGFTTTTGDWTTTAGTTIYYPAGLEPQAKTVAQYVHKANLVKSTRVTQVTLVLGGDGKQATTTKTTVTGSGGGTSGNAQNDRSAAQAGCIN